MTPPGHNLSLTPKSEQQSIAKKELTPRIQKAGKITYPAHCPPDALPTVFKTRLIHVFEHTDHLACAYTAVDSTT